MRVALIENRSRTRRELISMLAECDIATTEVDTPTDLTDILDDGAVNAVIVGEPTTGTKAELVRIARRHPRSARVAILGIVTELDSPEGMTLLENGADDLFTLPITAEDLGQTIRRSRWENTRELEASEMELRLIKPAQLLIDIFSQAGDGYFIATERGEIVAASTGMERLTGFEAAELAGETLEGLGLDPETPEEHAARLPERVTMTLVTSDWRKVPVIAETFEIRLAGVRCRFGIVREAESGQPVPAGSSEGAGISAQDLGALLGTITRNSSDALVIVDRHGRILHISRGFERVLGWQVEALVGRSIVDFVAPEDYAVVQPFSTGGTVLTGTIEGVRMLQENGELRVITLNIAALGENALLDGWVIHVQAPANGVLHHTRRLGGGGFYSLYDPVTALPNRLLFIDRLDHAIERSARVHSVMCCIDVSIDNFDDTIRDCSPDVLNLVLCEFSRRLHQTLREGDTVARIGDSDFAILAEGVGGTTEARILGERVSEAARAPFDTPDGPMRFELSIGAAISAPSGQNAGNLLRDAIAAMEYARKVNSERCVVFEDRMRDAVIDSLRLDDDLEGVEGRGELQIFYQPEVDIRTERIIGAEALVRWEHPRHGLILPGEFLALAEETGRLDAISLWIIESVCSMVQVWRRRYAEAAGIVGSVNISAQQLERESFADDVFAILERTDLPPENLRLEISNPDPTFMSGWGDAAHYLQSGGVRIGIQDLNPARLTTDLLGMLPVDTLKIDRTSMSAVVEDPSRPSLSKPLAQYAAQNDLQVIVSGIETAQHIARARILNYRFGQGYYYYRPVPAQTIEYLLMRGQQDGDVVEGEFGSHPLRATA